MSDSSHSIPTFAALAADPEIAPLLDFTPARRKVERPDGWTADRQRELIARIADTGSPGEACDAMDKNLSGAKHLYRSDGAESFRQAWKAAIALATARKRAARDSRQRFAGEVPGIAGAGSRSKGKQPAGPLPGQVRNECGEWEDEASRMSRFETAKDNIKTRLLRCRRAFLAEICDSPGKRAAFEILTELPIDWDKAARLEPQPDEPWNPVNMRRPDMVLTAESGWSFGEHGYGPDKKAELRRAVDQHREEAGLPPVDWERSVESESAEHNEQSRQSGRS